MSSIWNKRISVSIFGEETGPAVGVTIDNLPPGEFIDAELLDKFMMRRYPESLRNDSRRTSSPRIMSGITDDRTTGGPLCALLQNQDRKKTVSRPDPASRYGHADYTGAVRYKGYSDVVQQAPQFTDRLTAPFCFAGAVCGQILERRGIYTGGHIAQLHKIKDNPFDPVNTSRDAVLSVRGKNFPVINDRKGWDMLNDIEMAKKSGESLGGIIECAVVNLPAGIGSPLFDGLENTIAQLVFGIPGVAGLEFGSGFDSASMIGNQIKDEFYTNERGHSVTRTNNHGGIIGGISSGMPVTMRVAFKPAAPVMSEFDALPEASYEPCFVPKAVPCVESAVNIALLSHMLEYPNFC